MTKLLRNYCAMKKRRKENQKIKVQIKKKKKKNNQTKIIIPIYEHFSYKSFLLSAWMELLVAPLPLRENRRPNTFQSFLDFRVLVSAEG